MYLSWNSFLVWSSFLQMETCLFSALLALAHAVTGTWWTKQETGITQCRPSNTVGKVDMNKRPDWSGREDEAAGPPSKNTS